MDWNAYFARIGVAPPQRADLDALRAVHEGHAFSIPFENVDVFLHRDISLEPEDLLDKLVLRRRGGYCFEMNALLALALRELGFAVQDVICRGRRPEGLGMPLHRMELVSLAGERWVCDVGYGGDCPVSPLRLEVGLAQEQYGRTFRVMRDKTMDYRLEVLRDGVFAPTMAFDDRQAHPGDFVMGNFYTSRFPASNFRRSLMVTRPMKTGRISLSDRRLRVKDGGTVTEWVAETPEALGGILHQQFGIEEDIPADRFAELR